jgi:hypothetical protein
LGTAATAAFGVWTGLYYARRNLPHRLRELLAAADAKLLRDRGPLLKAIADARLGARVDRSAFYVEPLNRALGELGFAQFAKADKSLEKALVEINEQIATSKTQLSSMEEQKIAAHILRGSIASARAKTSSSSDEDYEAAEQELTSALEIRAGDLDALELRGRVRFLRNNEKGAFADFDKLIGVANETGNPVRVARGYLCRARFMNTGGRKQRLLKPEMRLRAASRP